MRAGRVHLGVPWLGRSVPAFRRRVRRGYMLFEVQVAFVVLGIGLAGLCPLVVMQLRQVRQLELRLRGQMIQTSRITGLSETMVIVQDGVISATPTHYLVPWQNPWARKLTGGAQIVASTSIPCDPGSLSPSGNSPSCTVSVVSGPAPVIDGPPYSYSVYVDVSPIP